MHISNEHNLHHPIATDCPYGIRVGLKAGDPFARLVGADWQKLHWYGSERERDAALAEMSRRYPTFRIGDEPSLTFEKVERLAGR